MLLLLPFPDNNDGIYGAVWVWYRGSGTGLVIDDGNKAIGRQLEKIHQKVLSLVFG